MVGSVGGGGALLALPVLVYVLGEGVSQATTASLIVVALAASLGGAALARHGHVCWRIALGFAAVAALGSVAGTALGAVVDGRTLILAFVPVMVAAASLTWRRTEVAADEGADEGCPDAARGTVAGLATGVGVLTGFFGVGGGFLIVPALTVGLGMPIRRAIASSLVIVSITALAALGSHVASGESPDVEITALLAASTAVGTLAGTSVGRRLPQQLLGRGFALVVVAIAALLLADVLLLGGPPAD